MDVGIRELKAELSAWVRRAAAGEVVTVTDRGRPVAVLGPVVGQVDLEAAAAEGWVQLPTTQGLGPVERQQASRSVAEVLDEDRA